AGIMREKWLEGFRLPADVNVAARNLMLYSTGSALYVALVDSAMAVIGVFVSLRLADLIIDRAGQAAAGVTAWAAVISAISVATVAHAFTTKALGRMAALGFMLAVVVAWLL